MDYKKPFLSIKPFSPYLLAIIAFLILSFGYFSPLLEGKQVFQPDTVKWKGMAKEIADFREETGEEALWTNSMFGGMPAFQISTHWSNNIANFFHKVFTLGLPSPANMLFMYFVGFFLLLLLLRVNPYVAMVGAVAFAFSSYNFIIILAGHNTKAIAIAYMAPVLASIIYTFRGKKLVGALLFTIFMGLQLRANHLQMTYYLAIIVLFYVVFEFHNQIKEGKIGTLAKSSGLLFAGLIIAIGINIGNFWGTYSYTSETMRGGSELTIGDRDPSAGLSKEYITQWSYGKAETFSLLIPNVKGGSSNAFLLNELEKFLYGNLSERSEARKELEKYPPGFVDIIVERINERRPISTYWGDQPFTSGPVYVGVVVLFFFFLGLFLVKGPLKWGLLLATILSIMLAWGKNFMPLTDFFIDFVPGYNKFRAVSMTLVIAGLTIPTLAFLALNKLVKEPGLLKFRGKEFFIASGLTAGLCLVFYLAPQMFFSFTSASENMQFAQWAEQSPGDVAQINLFVANLEDARMAIFRADALRSSLFALLAAAAVWLFILGKIKRTLFIGAVALLVLVDMWPINKRYLNDSHFKSRRQVENPFQPTGANQEILKDNDPHFRVFNRSGMVDPFNDTSTSWFHKSIGGYHGAKLQRYQDIIDFHLTQGNIEVFNMFNTKYFILPDDNRQPVAVINTNALGNAWFVSDFITVQNADEEIMELNDFDPVTTAVVHQDFSGFVEKAKLQGDTLSYINLTDYKPNRLVYSYKTRTQQLAVFSEIYYPDGWRATINDVEVEHFRVNYILRALLVPAGDGEIVFEFRPAQFHTGGKIALASSVLLLLFAFFVLAKELKPSLFGKNHNESIKSN